MTRLSVIAVCGALCGCAADLVGAVPRYSALAIVALDVAQIDVLSDEDRARYAEACTRYADAAEILFPHRADLVESFRFNCDLLAVVPHTEQEG